MNFRMSGHMKQGTHPCPFDIPISLATVDGLGHIKYKNSFWDSGKYFQFFVKIIRKY